MAKRTKPQHREIRTLRVLGSKRISPNVLRITAGGAGLEGFTAMGYDQWFRMFLPRPGQADLKLPTATSNLWYAQYLMTGKESRPTVRNYTIREFRAVGVTGPEFDIDFVIHDGGTPASDWATAAAPGDEFAILDEGLIYEPGLAKGFQLLVGDESALPAIAGVLASAPQDMGGEVFIEIPHEDDRQDLGEPEGVTVHWLPRANAHDHPGPLVLETVKAAKLPETLGYAYVAGESELATGLRRHLVGERGMNKQAVSFTGYWRFGKSQG
ncbi:siderophore-interacting protein [Rhodococcus sp. D2-41]|uniref:siderophore-interacting protein n=1 Tax=Speluncibacter jeojiensis TaxID=2710754 RepID=UPI00240F36B2|nr:siderophore-interacting protein [Rhodococcus sp. D2-41]MDG3009878.1 siderophore-interacting protein [Rhodococcus sp. D2-41]